MITQMLIARVKARNSVNTEANKLFPTLNAIFVPFVGQKILTKDGSLLSKISKLLPEFSRTPKMHIYRSTSNYSLMWNVQASEMCSENSCVYAEASVRIGSISDGVLESLYDAPKYRTDYTVEDIEAKRNIYAEAKKLADSALSDLYPFGEYDR